MSKKVITFYDSEKQEHDFPIITPDYGVCDTIASDANKIVTCDEFTLFTGATVTVNFKNAPTTNTISLNVNDSGLIAVDFNSNDCAAKDEIKANGCYDFIYNGTKWIYKGSSANKVDKVSGKSLIDKNVADRLSYDSTTTNIVVSSISQGIEALNFIGMNGNASISANGLISGQHLTIETDGADNIPGVVGIEAKNGDVTANVCIDPDSGAYKLHKLSEKVNASDVLTKTNTTKFTPTADYQPATKKYVDDNKADTTNLVGKKGNTETSDLFNDVNNNLASGKVFTITAVNDKELTVDLSSLTTEELSTFNSIQAGAICCVDTSAEQDNIKIVSVDGANGKIVVENAVSALAVEDGTIDGDPTHRNYILILDYPNLGNTYDKTINAHAEGENTQALARGTHSEGRDSKAIGQYAHSEGLGTMAGYGSHSEGRYTKALGNMSHSEGHLTNAYGHNSHSEGRDTTATGYASHAEGNMTEASGAHSHSEGIKTKATGETSHAEGSTTEASGAFSHSEGRDTIAQGDYSHAEGIGTKAIEKYSHAEGANVQATGEMSHAEGGSTVAEGRISHAEGNYSTAKGNTSHAEGISTSANGAYSHAEGNNTKANGESSHAEGKQTEAGLQAHAEGDQTKATGETAHAEGRLTEASGASSHAEGKNTKATGYRAHAEGMNTKATSESAHSEGIDTEANGRASHSEGTGTVANGENQHTQGKYNVKDTENKYAHIIGNGTSDTARSNAHTVDWKGNAWFAGDIEGVKDGVIHKLSDKVDKVVGKGLVDATDIRTAVQSDNLTLADEKKITLRSTESGDTGTNVINASGMTVGYNNMKTTIGCDSARFSFTDTNENVFITPNDVTINQGGKTVHKLSSKANSSDVFLKSGDVVLAKGKIIKVTKDGESTVHDGSTENIQIRGDAMFIRANDVEPYGLMLSKDGIVLDTDNNESVDIESGEITVYKKNSNGNSVAHKLTEKMSVSDLESYLLNGGQKSIIGDLYVNGGESSTNDITLWRVENNEPVTHKLSEKANAADIGSLSDLTTTNKTSIVAAINEVKSSGGGDVLDNLTYDSTNDIINSDANLLLTNTNSVAAYNGTFRGDIKIGQLGANKWAYTISPITGFSTSVDVTCTSGNVVHNLASKADTTNVLTRNNTQTFTPTGDYQPATKKYVDDAIAALKAELGLE